MPPGRAYGGWSAFLPGTRILASEVNTRLVVRALVVSEAFSSLTTSQRIPYVTSGASAHRPFFPAAVMSWSTDRVRAAGIRLAQITRFKQSTADEGVASHMPRATTDRSYTAQIAVGVDAAYPDARVHAFIVETGRFAARTLRMRGALRTA